MIARVPQRRWRIFLVGVRKWTPSAIEFERDFSWPEEVDCPSVLAFLDRKFWCKDYPPRNKTVDRNLDYLDERIGNGDFDWSKAGCSVVADLAASKKRMNASYDVSPCLTVARCTGRGFYILFPDEAMLPKAGSQFHPRMHRMDITDCAKLQGFGEARLRQFRDADLTDRQLLSAFGNAINLPVMKAILQKLMPILKVDGGSAATP